MSLSVSGPLAVPEFEEPVPNDPREDGDPVLAFYVLAGVTLQDADPMQKKLLLDHPSTDVFQVARIH